MSRTRDFHKPDSACRDVFWEQLDHSRDSRKAYHGYGKDGTVFVHCHNHVIDGVAGERFEDYPFDDADKEVILRLFLSTLRKYRIEALSFCCMSNHFHCLLVADNRKFTPEQMAKKYNKIYAESIKTKSKDPMNASSPKCKRMADHSNDISHFMRDFQHSVTVYYNRKNDRKGTLWRGHFKSVLVERARALVNMIAYIELNPVRAGIVDDAANYLFSFWGQWHKHGRHQFQQAFGKYLRDILADDGQKLSTKEDLFLAFKEVLRRISELKEEAQKNYTESLALGSDDFCTTCITERHSLRDSS